MILVLSTWDLSDPSFGGARRVDALLNVLGRRTVLVQPRAVHPRYATAPFPLDLGRRKVGINWGIFNFLLPSTQRITTALLRHHSPQLVVLTSMWTWFPLRRFPNIPCVLDAHDVNATAIAERFGTHHPFTRLVRAVERKVVHAVDHLFVCSDRDREQYMLLYGLDGEKITVVPNGVDTSTFGTDVPETILDQEEHLGDSCVLFFMGKLNYQPNAEGLRFLDRTVMPELERKAPGRFKILITGGPVPTERYHPSMIFAGRLPDAQLVRAIQRADICLAPVFSGSGTRLKVLEYMAAAKPIVSTGKGAEGITYRANEELIVADEGEFATTILALAEDKARALAMGKAARNRVKQEYDWQASVQPRWLKVLQYWVDLTPPENRLPPLFSTQ